MKEIYQVVKADGRGKQGLVGRYIFPRELGRVGSEIPNADKFIIGYINIFFADGQKENIFETEIEKVKVTNNTYFELLEKYCDRVLNYYTEEYNRAHERADQAYSDLYKTQDRYSNLIHYYKGLLKKTMTSADKFNEATLMKAIAGD